MDIFIGFPIGLVAASALGTWHSYNRLVTLDRRCEKAAADIEAHLNARNALAPELVAAAHSHAGRQRGILNNLKVASAAALEARQPDATRRAEDFFAASFTRAAQIVETIPALRECPRIAQLKRDIADCNAKIAAARDAFGVAVRSYNKTLATFPGRHVGALTHMAARPTNPAAARNWASAAA